MSEETKNNTPLSNEELGLKAGVLVFETVDGALRYQPIGELTTQRLTYLLRYMQKVEDNLWSGMLYDSFVNDEALAEQAKEEEE